MAIQKILKEAAKKNKGMTLITEPVGSGKSYGTAMAIPEIAKESKKKIFYVTPRLKNLSDIEEQLFKNFKTEIGKDKILKIDSFRLCIKKNLDILKTNKVIKGWKETIELIEEAEKIDSPLETPGDKEKFDDREKEFRKKLRIEFNNSYQVNKEYKSKYDYMKNSKWNFISSIYPAAEISKKQIIIMSTRKFFLKNDPIIDFKYYFTDKKNIENSLVILDEIDVMKNEILDIILDNNKEKDIREIIELISQSLVDIRKIDPEFRTHTNIKKYIDEMRKRLKELTDKYFPINFKIKYYTYTNNKYAETKLKSKFMNYQGVNYFYYDRIDNLYYYPNFEDLKYNKIVEKGENKKKPKGNNYPLEDVIYEFNKFIKFCFWSFYIIAKEYHEENPDSAWEDSITTSLTKLTFDSETSKRFLKYIVSMIFYKNKLSENKEDSLYFKNISYTLGLEMEKFKGILKLNNYSISCTPELVVLKLARDAHVIGISATAEVGGINNFNLDFLKKELGEYFYQLSDEKLKSLEEDYKNKTRGYDKVKTKIIGIPSFVDVNENRKALFEVLSNITSIDIQKLKNDPVLNSINIKMQSSKRNNNFEIKKIGKILLYIKNILELYKKDGVISNGIIITNKLISNNHILYNLETIKYLAKYVYSSVFNVELEKSEDVVNDMFIVIGANDLKNSQKYQEKFKTKFIENKPIFMLTSYNSVSRGNNLQIKIGKNKVLERIKEEKLIKINDWDINGYLDWDSIYLENPTHIIPNINEMKGNLMAFKDKLKALLLIEELGEKRELTEEQKRDILKDFFLYFETENVFPKYNYLYSAHSIKLDYITSIYQATGRISRTNVKKDYNLIAYDDDILTKMDVSDGKLPRLLTNEFKRFREVINQELLRRETDDIYIKSNQRIAIFIENEILSKKWDRRLIDFWEHLREFILKYPVITKEEIKNCKNDFKKYNLPFSIDDIYIKFKENKNKYFYETKDGNFKNVIQNDDCKMEASIEDSRLYYCLENENIRKCWKEKGYRENWDIVDGEIYGIINPCIYNNIYKGAIGEEVIKIVLEEFGIKCEDIKDPDIYEKFDYLIKNNGKHIYIDMKNFGNSTIESDLANEYLEKKIKNKINYFEENNKPISLALVVNLINENSHRKPNIRNKKIKSIPGLFYLNENSKLEFLKENIELIKENIEL